MSLNSELDTSGVFSSSNLDVTGSITVGSYRIITRHFDQYEITLKVSMDNKSVEVIEVKINKDFLSHKQKMASLNYYDVGDYIKP